MMREIFNTDRHIYIDHFNRNLSKSLYIICIWSKVFQTVIKFQCYRERSVKSSLYLSVERVSRDNSCVKAVVPVNYVPAVNQVVY